MKKFLLDENGVNVCKIIMCIRHLLHYIAFDIELLGNILELYIVSQESNEAHEPLYFNEVGYKNLS